MALLLTHTVTIIILIIPIIFNRAAGRPAIADLVTDATLLMETLNSEHCHQGVLGDGVEAVAAMRQAIVRSLLRLLQDVEEVEG